MLVGHHNITDALAWAVSMVRITFGDDIGNSKTVTGTGFWLSTTDDHTVFVTNRHVVDASLGFRHDPTLSKMNRTKTEVHVRQGDPEFLAYAPGHFFEVTEPRWVVHPDADVAILRDAKPNTSERQERYQVYGLSETVLADGAWINTKLRMMDECYFVGYPAVETNKGESVRFYDVAANFPIARQAIIASGPFYTHRDVKTTGVMLVSGMSFHGSSGSPVITPLLGMPPGSISTHDPHSWTQAKVVAEHRESRLIGIMTGKFETREIDREFTHAGLSYFTRAGYISELIRSARDVGWK